MNRLKTTIESYGNYSNSNYGSHCLRVKLETGDSLYYSYKTLIAFDCPDGLIVSKNYWGPTTGKHLNWINGNKNSRLNRDAFDDLFNKHHNQVKINEFINA